MNYKFNIGDKVRFIGDPEDYAYLRRNVGITLEKGDAGVVKEESSVPFVLFDKCPYKDIAVVQENLELVPVNRTFKVGDIVRIVKKTGHAYANFPLGIKAKVIAERESSSAWDYIVQLISKGATVGWTHDHIYPNCQNVMEADLELVKDKKAGSIVLFRQDNKVIAKLTYGKAVVAVAEAKCSPNDTFNFAIGSQIALQRLCRKMGDGSSAIVIPEDLRLNELFMY